MFDDPRTSTAVPTVYKSYSPKAVDQLQVFLKCTLKFIQKQFTLVLTNIHFKRRSVLFRMNRLLTE